MSERVFALLMVGGIFALIGGIFLTIGLIFVGHERRFIQRALQATGTVDDFDFHDGCEYPIVSYYADGRLVRARSNFGTSRSPFMVGDTVDIWYLPDNPKRFVLGGDRASKLLGWIFTGLGGVFFVIGIALLVVFFLNR